MSPPEIWNRSKLYLMRNLLVWVENGFVFTTSAITFPCSDHVVFVTLFLFEMFNLLGYANNTNTDVILYNDVFEIDHFVTCKN